VMWPSSKNMPNQNYYLECNGQKIPSSAEFNDLRNLIGDYVPNLNNYFLRSTTTASNVLKTYSDTFKSHTHSASGNLNNKYIDDKSTFSMYFEDRHTGINPNPEHYDAWPGASVAHLLDDIDISGEGITVTKFHCYACGDSTERWITGTKVSNMKLKDSSVSITVRSTGSSETAPKHMMMRYFIRARH